MEGRGQDREARRRATRRGIAPSQPDSPKGQTDASQGDSVSVSGGFIVTNVRGLNNRTSTAIRLFHKNVDGVREKIQSNQRRDDVLRRMLNTPPQPKTADKSGKESPKTKPSEGATPKSLRDK